jgi:adenosine deaminase
MSEHPIRKMLALGLNASVNSDDPAYFGGYMNENFYTLIDAAGLTRDEIFQLTINGFESSFLTQADKQIHLDRIAAMR